MTSAEAGIDEELPARDRFVAWTWVGGGLAGCAAGTALSIHVESPLGFLAAPAVTLTVVLATLIVRWRLRPETIVPRRHLLGPGIALALLVASREGALGGTLQWDVSSYRTDSTANWSTTTIISLGTKTPLPGTPATPASRSTVAVAANGPLSWQMASALERALLRRAWSQPNLDLTVRVDAPGSWSFVPFYKSGTYACVATVHAKWGSPGNGGEVITRIEGTIRQTLVGIASRRCFNEMLASNIGDQIKRSVDSESLQ